MFCVPSPVAGKGWLREAKSGEGFMRYQSQSPLSSTLSRKGRGKAPPMMKRNGVLATDTV